MECDYLAPCIDILEAQYWRIRINAQEPRKPNCSFFVLTKRQKDKSLQAISYAYTDNKKTYYADRQI